LANISFPSLQVARLETQVTRYRTAAETSEKSEDELKAEKRKLQREVKHDWRHLLFILLFKDLFVIPIHRTSLGISLCCCVNINWFHTFMYIGSTQLRELKQLYDETDAARRTLQRQYDKLKHTR
jgi:hypothetical protein